MMGLQPFQIVQTHSLIQTSNLGCSGKYIIIIIVIAIVIVINIIIVIIIIIINNNIIIIITLHACSF